MEIVYDASPKSYLERFIILRDNWSEEIPKEIICGITTVPSPKYKVRNNWYQAIIADAENVIMGEYVTDKSKELYDQFRVYIKETNWGYRLSTREDIDRGNELLSSLIEDLKNYKIPSKS